LSSCQICVRKHADSFKLSICIGRNNKYDKGGRYDQKNKYENKRNVKKSSEEIVFGVHPVIEAIRAGRELNKIIIAKGIQKELFLELKEELKGKDYQLQFVPVEKLNALTEMNHQGVIAFVAPIDYYKIETIVDELIAADKKPYVLALDRITDVRNFGAIARTAECMGVDAILLPSKGSVQVTADAVKTSAGALNRIKVCKSESLKDSLFYIQQCGLRIVACTEKSSVPLHETNLRGAVCVVMGSEKDGITQDLINLADISCKIPMPGEISSLNVGVATGMILYEKIRQEIF